MILTESSNPVVALVAPNPAMERKAAATKLAPKLYRR